MNKDVTLILATEEDAQLLHKLKYEAFLPLYEKYHDDETSPALAWRGTQNMARGREEEKEGGSH